MNNRIWLIICTVLPLVLLLSCPLSAGQQEGVEDGEKEGGSEARVVTEIPELHDIIPLAAELSGRFAELNNQLEHGPDLFAIDKGFTGIDVEFIDNVRSFDQLVSAERFSAIKTYTLIHDLLSKRAHLAEVSEPLEEEITRINRLKTKWREEGNRWDSWRVALMDDSGPQQLELAFDRALGTIETAQNLVRKRLNTMLTLQNKGADITARIETLRANLRGMVSEARQDYIYRKSSPMYSHQYFSKFNSEMGKTALDGLLVMSLPSSDLYRQNGWNFILQLLSFIVALVIIFRNREVLGASEQWRFLAERPFSSAMFIAVMSSLPFIEYLPVSDPLKLVYTIVGGISCVRILEQVQARGLKRRAVRGIVLLFLITEIIITIGLPLPLIRLYILLASLLAIRLLLRWSKEKSIRDEGGLLLLSIRAFICFFVVIAVTVFLENAGLAAYLFKSMVVSLAFILPCILFIHMIYGGLNWVFFKSPVWKVKLLRNDANSMVQRFGFLLAAATLAVGLFPGILMAWDLYDSIPVAIRSIYSLGVELGDQRITLAMVVMSALSLYLAYLAALILPKVLLDETITGHKMARGVQRSIGQLMKYGLIFIGCIIAFSQLGFNFSKFTLILSAFGVGIGFGLQGIVNNFVSGLILLFERPLTEGDTIEVGTDRVHIKKIGLRSTIVQTFDQANLIIPNADLINNQVLNWTLNNREVRLRVPVGVAYGSNVTLVVEIMIGCAKNQKDVVKSPAPEVLFMEFGESSLNFELRVWVLDVDRRLQVKSNLYHEIEQRFREEGVEIPFPQRDLHLRSSFAPTGLVPATVSAGTKEPD